MILKVIFEHIIILVMK